MRLSQFETYIFELEQMFFLFLASKNTHSTLTDLNIQKIYSRTYDNIFELISFIFV